MDHEGKDDGKHSRLKAFDTIKGTQHMHIPLIFVQKLSKSGLDTDQIKSILNWTNQLYFYISSPSVWLSNVLHLKSWMDHGERTAAMGLSMPIFVRFPTVKNFVTPQQLPSRWINFETDNV
jgi:hypothetical protein